MKRLLVLLLLLPALLLAQNFNPNDFGISTEENLPKGLDVGEKAPNFNVKDNHGNKVNLKQILKSKSVIIIFYRGQWCPVCTKYMRNISDSLNYLKERNVVLIAIGPETQENAIRTEFKTGAYFSVIPNGERIMKAYDVIFKVKKEYQKKIRDYLKIDIKKNNNQIEAQLPVPATFIINQQGKIVYKQFNLDYTKRASVRQMLAHL